MAEKFSLKDHLFNADSLGDLAQDYARGVEGFSAQAFLDEVLPKLPALELMERMEAIADGIEAQLASDFPTMAAQIDAAMIPELDPTKTDDDFGRFIYAVPGILAVRHGLEDHRERAFDLLYEATKRFSMEFYIRAFFNRWPVETLARMRLWMHDDNYHVRRLVTEGSRPKLPWAKSISLDPLVPLEFLDVLYADKARFVTRSVANHLNDIAKFDPSQVVARLAKWRDAGLQTPKEIEWITRHALRTLVKSGHVGALELLGYHADAPVSVSDLTVTTPTVARGAPVSFSATITAPEACPVLVDYVIWFVKADGKTAPKTFKLKQGKVTPEKPFTVSKTHKLKWDATTFKLFPGAHRIGLQVNGKLLADAPFTLE